MTRAVARECIIAATLLNGILASSNINRGFIDMPAWHQVGATPWAAFSRHADLGHAAMILYPFEAICGAMLSVAAAVSFRRSRVGPRQAALPVYAAALLAIGGLAATTQAAPIMLSVRHLTDPADLGRALDGFTFWGGIRGVCQVLTYLANFWSLLAIGFGGNLTDDRRSATVVGRGSGD